MIALLLAGAIALGCWTVGPVTVIRVVDGDTFDMRTRIWPGLLVDERVRVLGVDAAEMNTANGPAAKAFTATWLTGRQVAVVVCKRDAFGRSLGKVLDAATEEALADGLIKAGLGVPR